MLKRLNQSYFSPYFIFIQGGYKYSDEEILQQLGLQAYTLVEDENEKNNPVSAKCYLFLTEDDNWTYLMDDWSYSLWHESGLVEQLIRLSSEFDVFTFYVGDSDDSFGFAYYRKGAVLRKYIVEDPYYRGGETVLDVGPPFPIEKEALLKEDLFEKVMTIATSFGIKTDFHKEKVRIYGRIKKPRGLSRQT